VKIDVGYRFCNAWIVPTRARLVINGLSKMRPAAKAAVLLGPGEKCELQIGKFPRDDDCSSRQTRL
jgi:hypothetical protein